MSNPFSPTFGVTPSVLIERDGILEEFRSALEGGPGESGRSTIFVGARGVGKTVMLNECHDVALECGWQVIEETATPGFISRIVEGHLPEVINRLKPPSTARPVQGVGVLGNAITLGAVPTALQPTGLHWLLETVERALGRTGDRDNGLLISLDEVHHQQIDELRVFAAEFQLALRRRMDIAFVGAGLPSAVESVLNDNVLSFLRRSEVRRLGAVDTNDVQRRYVSAIVEGGRTIGEAESWRAARATGGYPFMVQLVGKHMWNASRGEHAISFDDVDTGIALAQQKLGTSVHEPSLQGLDGFDRSVLLAMLEDDYQSVPDALAMRLGIPSDELDDAVRRLIAHDVVAMEVSGRIAFAIPALRDYLLDHRARYAFKASVEVRVAGSRASEASERPTGGSFDLVVDPDRSVVGRVSMVDDDAWVEVVGLARTDVVRVGSTADDLVVAKHAASSRKTVTHLGILPKLIDLPDRIWVEIDRTG